MATTIDSERERIFGRLDEIFHGPDSGSTSDDPFGEAISIAANTSDKEYFKLTGSSNATSNSKLLKLHECPRLYELEGLKAAAGLGVGNNLQTNLDFAFGHAVGSGIQTYGATGNLVASQYAAFTSWRAPYEAEKTDKKGNVVGKSLPMALHAVEKFSQFREQELGEYQVLRLPSGQPAVELSFAIDTGNGFFHFGHIDTVLQNVRTKKLAVWEGKTRGTPAQDADYANSYQALGYSVVVDAVAEQLDLPGQDYEVLYIVYDSKNRAFQLLPFTKSRSQRAEWLQDLLLNHAMLSKYQELKFYPKRGESCINKWGKTCSWYGTCQMRNESLFPSIVPAKIASIEQLKTVDFTFTLDQLVQAQKNRA